MTYIIFPVQWQVPEHNSPKRDCAAVIKSWKELADLGKKTAFSWRWVAGKVRVVRKSGFDCEI